MKKLTTNEFIKKLKVVHGNKYDTSKVEYIDATTKICLICPKHGEFWIQPNNLLSGQGCRMCGIEKRAEKRKLYNNDTFKKEAKKIHGTKYIYDESEYVSCDTKLKIICPIHGEFWQTPYHHIHDKNGCPKCAKNLIYATEEWVKHAKEIHGDKYDYSKARYIDSQTKICIICPKHGEFWQKPINHINGCGCPKCQGKNKTTEDFINEASEVHDNKYKYLSEYNGAYGKVKIVCPIHGEFEQKAHSHLMGNGCPLCSASKLELKIMRFLNNQKIKFTHEKHFDWLGQQHLDFYLVDYNVAIECQGEQHFKGTNYGSSTLTNEESFELVKERDIKKNKLCEENNVHLIYFANKKHIKNVDLLPIYSNSNLFTDINDLLIDIRKKAYGW